MNFFSDSTVTAPYSYQQALHVFQLVVVQVAGPGLAALEFQVAPQPAVGRLVQRVGACGEPGRHQQRHGWEFNPAGRDTDTGMRVTETTFAEMLASRGYATGMVGKWHLGYGEIFDPLSRGFDEYFGVLAGGSIFIDVSGAFTMAGGAMVEADTQGTGSGGSVQVFAGEMTLVGPGTSLSAESTSSARGDAGSSILDVDGKEVYSGPYDSNKGVAGLPADAQEILKKMKIDVGKLKPPTVKVGPPKVVPNKEPEGETL